MALAKHRAKYWQLREQYEKDRQKIGEEAGYKRQIDNGLKFDLQNTIEFRTKVGPGSYRKREFEGQEGLSLAPKSSSTTPLYATDSQRFAWWWMEKKAFSITKSGVSGACTPAVPSSLGH